MRLVMSSVTIDRAIDALVSIMSDSTYAKSSSSIVAITRGGNAHNDHIVKIYDDRIKNTWFLNIFNNCLESAIKRNISSKMYSFLVKQLQQNKDLVSSILKVDESDIDKIINDNPKYINIYESVDEKGKFRIINGRFFITSSVRYPVIQTIISKHKIKATDVTESVLVSAIDSEGYDLRNVEYSNGTYLRIENRKSHHYVRVHEVHDATSVVTFIQSLVDHGFKPDTPIEDLERYVVEDTVYAIDDDTISIVTNEQCLAAIINKRHEGIEYVL